MIGRQLGARRRNIALNLDQDRAELFVRRERPRHPQLRLQLIQRAVGLQAKVVFGDLLAAEQAGLTQITFSRVDLRAHSHPP